MNTSIAASVFMLLVVLVGVGNALAFESAAAASEPAAAACARALEAIDRPAPTAPRGPHEPKRPNYRTLSEAAWAKCQGEEVPANLQARAAMQLRMLVTPEREDEILTALESSVDRLRASKLGRELEIPLLEAMGDVRKGRGDSEIALRLFDEALGLRRQIYGLDSPEVAFGALVYANTLVWGIRTGTADPHGGLAVVEQAVRTLADARGEADPIVIQFRSILPQYLRGAGKLEEADVLERRTFAAMAAWSEEERAANTAQFAELFR